MQEEYAVAHAKFRQTKAWKEFRLKVIEERGCRCQACGIKKKPKSLQLHHLFPKDYEDLEPEKFAVLCSRCHDNIEAFSRRYRSKKANEIANMDAWLAIYGMFLPHYE